MGLNEYQEKAMTTCMESSNNFSYMMLNLVGEVGEFASKVAKAIRKEKLHIGDEMNPNDLYFSKHAEWTEIESELKKEAGDILWQTAGLCHIFGWDLEEIAALNLEKLQARKSAGTIDGSGDGITREERCVE